MTRSTRVQRLRERVSASSRSHDSCYTRMLSSRANKVQPYSTDRISCERDKRRTVERKISETVGCVHEGAQVRKRRDWSEYETILYRLRTRMVEITVCASKPRVDAMECGVPRGGGRAGGRRSSRLGKPKDPVTVLALSCNGSIIGKGECSSDTKRLQFSQLQEAVCLKRRWRRVHSPQYVMG